MSPGLLFCACSFSKSPLYVLQEAVFPPTLIANCHPLFIHSQGKGIPAHIALPVTASYPSRILMQKAWLLDADCNVI